jgi:hypothetical protein
VEPGREYRHINVDDAMVPQSEYQPSTTRVPPSESVNSYSGWSSIPVHIHSSQEPSVSSYVLELKSVSRSFMSLSLLSPV